MGLGCRIGFWQANQCRNTPGADPMRRSALRATEPFGGIVRNTRDLLIAQVVLIIHLGEARPPRPCSSHAVPELGGGEMMSRTVLVAAAAAVALGGCGVDKASEQARQLDAIGDVQVSTVFCTSGDSDRDSRTCAPYDRPHRGQALVAYLLPDGSTAPAQFADDGVRVDFRRSESYGAYMEANYPRPGMHWTGYVSDPYSAGAGASAAFTVSPRLTIPGAGAPFEGPYRYRVEGGYRELDEPGDDGSAPVACAGDPATDCGGGDGTEDGALATRDLAVLPGGDAPAVVAGSHASVPFDLRFAGARVRGARFALAASGDLAGARFIVSQDQLEPGDDSDNPVAVDVAVPAATPLGTYEVNLTATVSGPDDPIIRKVRGARVVAGGTELRAGTMRFRVVAPPADPPPPPAGARTPVPMSGPVPVPMGASVPAPADPQPSQPSRPGRPSPRPHRARASLRLSLAALPKRAHAGDYASYLMIARNRAAQPAVRTSVCEALPGRVQFVQASRRVRFSGRSVCIDRPRLEPGAVLATLVYVHVDVDARPGMAHARATATAANADRARAAARLRVLRRAAVVHRAPVTG
jgi:hypothetical protein